MHNGVIQHCFDLGCHKLNNYQNLLSKITGFTKYVNLMSLDSHTLMHKLHVGLVVTIHEVMTSPHKYIICIIYVQSKCLCIIAL